ncbi:hypothetical protein F4803DRAFT_419542 [Xylaria telfairii]|nr:hypothetical protein F4803DRAFT_419542 [Xylaria telfairii]
MDDHTLRVNETMGDIPLRPPDYNKKQWKYVGYRGFCEFLASDNDFLVLRRFSRLSIRILLALQDELSELEKQLETLEQQLMHQQSPDIHNGSFRQETEHARLQLIREIDKRLRSFYELVSQQSELRSRPRVLKKDIDSIRNWFGMHRNAILADETEYITHERDLFSMVTRPRAPLRKLLERSSHFRSFSLWQKRSLDEGRARYTSEQRIEFCVSTIVIIIGLAMLIAPLWILANIGDMVLRLTVITAFVVAFLPLVTFTSTARPFETLAATAGYTAVLVVFLQIGAPNTN